MSESIFSPKYKKTSLVCILLTCVLWILAVLVTGVNNETTCSFYGSFRLSFSLIGVAQATAIVPYAMQVVVYLKRSTTKTRILKSVGLMLLVAVITSLLSAMCMFAVFVKSFCFTF